MSADRAAVGRHIADKLPLPWTIARDLLEDLGRAEATIRMLQATNQELANRLVTGAGELQEAASSLEKTRATWNRMETEIKRTHRHAQRIYDAITAFLTILGSLTDRLFPTSDESRALRIGPPPPAAGLEEQAEGLEILLVRLKVLASLFVPLSDPHFVSDECLRCGRTFLDQEVTRLVRGGPNAKYHDVGLIVCEGCVSRDYDVVIGLGIYRRTAAMTAEGRWPRYVGHAGVAGYARVSRLDNGVFRVGLHRGHVEVWTAAEVQAYRAGSRPAMAYSREYRLYGSADLFPDGHQDVEQRFVDLSQPEAP